MFLLYAINAVTTILNITQRSNEFLIKLIKIVYKKTNFYYKLMSVNKIFFNYTNLDVNLDIYLNKEDEMLVAGKKWV